MQRFFSYLKQHSYDIFRGLLFLISVALLVLMFPRGGKFRYEFQKGKPWLHETYIAKFDFPIYKSEAQFKKERDSIEAILTPYFNVDTAVLKKQLLAFNNFFIQKKSDYIASNFANVSVGNRKYRNFVKFSDDYQLKAGELIQNIYLAGIVESIEYVSEVNEDAKIVLLNGNIAQEVVKSSVYTQKKAYEIITDQSTQFLQELLGTGYETDDFFKHLNLYDFIEGNLFYNEETTKRVKDEALTAVSTTKGMVQEGERIISQGDVVDNEAFRVLESLKYEFENRKGSARFAHMVIYGQIIFIIACIGVLFLFLRNFRNEILQNTLKTTFILFMVLLMVGISSLIIRYNLNFDEHSILYIIPFAILPVIIKTFYDNRLALFIHIITILLIGFIAPNSFEFVFLNFIVGTVAIFSLTSVHRRGKMFLSTALVILTYSFLFFGISITQETQIKDIEWIYFIFFGLNGILVLLAYPLIYFFEKIFGFLSDVTLLELADTNQSLLRELAESAPGTFQHSMQVANLAESVIHKVGGNPLLVRTGALYHDIGKMRNAIYFTENQSSGFNPHDNHLNEDSARIIISHVTDGVEIAKKKNIPQPIIDFITTHHGTARVKYFYRKAQQENPDKEIDISLYTYPGTKPYSKETAVLMMADAIEAASRSIGDYSEKAIEDLIETIINEQMDDKQFENVDFTFKDITTIKGLFKEKLMNIYHARIKYPKKNSA